MNPKPPKTINPNLRTLILGLHGLGTRKGNFFPSCGGGAEGISCALTTPSGERGSVPYTGGEHDPILVSALDRHVNEIDTMVDISPLGLAANIPADLSS